MEAPNYGASRTDRSFLNTLIIGEADRTWQKQYRYAEMLHLGLRKQLKTD
jgi:hypothetical protein